MTEQELRLGNSSTLNSAYLSNRQEALWNLGQTFALIEEGILALVVAMQRMVGIAPVRRVGLHLNLEVYSVPVMLSFHSILASEIDPYTLG